MNLLSASAHRVLGPGFNVKPKPRRKPHPAQHPQVVLLEPLFRPPNRPHHPRIQIVQPSNIINHRRAQPLVY